MVEKEFDIDEPIIYCSHNFNLSDRMTFANDLAKRLGININLTEGADVVIDAIIIPNATVTKNLYCQKQNNSSDFKYVLEFGDEAHLFYDNYIQYMLPTIADYNGVIEELTSNEENDNNLFLNCIFELKQFGASEVHFNKYSEVNLSNEVKSDWVQVEKAITNLENHYTYKL
jgi:hypothetical protein